MELAVAAGAALQVVEEAASESAGAALVGQALAKLLGPKTALQM